MLFEPRKMSDFEIWLECRNPVHHSQFPTSIWNLGRLFPTMFSAGIKRDKTPVNLFPPSANKLFWQSWWSRSFYHLCSLVHWMFTALPVLLHWMLIILFNAHKDFLKFTWVFLFRQHVKIHVVIFIPTVMWKLEPIFGPNFLWEMLNIAQKPRDQARG